MPPPPPPPSFGGTAPGYQQAQQVPPFASWGTRVGGYIINGLVAVLFYLPAVIAFFAGPKKRTECTINGEPGSCNLPTGPGWAIIAVLGIVGVVAYFVMYSRMVARTGQAWGHKAVGVRIVDAARVATSALAKRSSAS